MNKARFAVVAALVFSAVSVSSALYARGSTINLCANKKTGALRYLKNGSCSNSENKLELDPNGEVGQTGPQGLQGAQGPAGPAGSDGANGANGSNASSVMLQDATGAKFVWVPGYIFWNGMLWPFQAAFDSPNSYINALPYYYIDSACTEPFFPASGWAQMDGPQVVRVTTSDNTVNGQILHGWKKTGSLLSIQRASNYYHWGFPGCVAESGTILIDGDRITTYFAAEPIAWPVIVNPTLLVQGS